MKAIFLSTFRFPNNDAGSLRYSFLSKLFSEKGYLPYFIGKGDSSLHQYSQSNYGYYTSLKSKNNNILIRLLDTLTFFERKLIKEVKRTAHPGDIVVITCFFSKRTNMKIINFAKKNGIRVIFAIEEKYSKSELDKKNIISRVGYSKCVSFYKNIATYNKPIIAISSYIGKFAEEANVPFVVIPFVFDETIEIPELTESHSDKIKFFYAGSPGKKDMLEEMIKGFSLLDQDENRNAEVNIFGIDNLTARSLFPLDLLDSVQRFVFFRGKVSREIIEKEIIKSDFSILLRRKEEEYAMAGFPTKVAESLFYGIPVITNLTSDLDLYLIDGFNSIIVEGQDANSFSKSIKVALSLSKDKLKSLKENSKETSLNKLTVGCFKNEFDAFFAKLF